jgi:hypothetical protein
MLSFSDVEFSKFVRLKKEYYKLVRSSKQISSPFKSVKTGEEIRVIWTVRNLPNSSSSLCQTGAWCTDMCLFPGFSRQSIYDLSTETRTSRRIKGSVTYSLS